MSVTFSNTEIKNLKEYAHGYLLAGIESNRLFYITEALKFNKMNQINNIDKINLAFYAFSNNIFYNKTIETEYDIKRIIELFKNNGLDLNYTAPEYENQNFFNYFKSKAYKYKYDKKDILETVLDLLTPPPTLTPTEKEGGSSRNKTKKQKNKKFLHSIPTKNILCSLFKIFENIKINKLNCCFN